MIQTRIANLVALSGSVVGLIVALIYTTDIVCMVVGFPVGFLLARTYGEWNE
jgi:ABC-type proline/glycine betaine transport system permease subunit